MKTYKLVNIDEVKKYEKLYEETLGYKPPEWYSYNPETKKINILNTEYKNEDDIDGIGIPHEPHQIMKKTCVELEEFDINKEEDRKKMSEIILREKETLDILVEYHELGIIPLTYL